MRRKRGRAKVQRVAQNNQGGDEALSMMAAVEAEYASEREWAQQLTPDEQEWIFKVIAKAKLTGKSVAVELRGAWQERYEFDFPKHWCRYYMEDPACEAGRNEALKKVRESVEFLLYADPVRHLAMLEDVVDRCMTPQLVKVIVLKQLIDGQWKVTNTPIFKLNTDGAIVALREMRLTMEGMGVFDRSGRERAELPLGKDGVIQDKVTEPTMREATRAATEAEQDLDQELELLMEQEGRSFRARPEGARWGYEEHLAASREWESRDVLPPWVDKDRLNAPDDGAPARVIPERFDATDIGAAVLESEPDRTPG